MTSLAVIAQAKVSGKISGMVEDTETGEPLIGATIRVIGTNLITQTDEDGEYYVIGVPVGKYDLMVTHVGFETVQKKDVRVLLDLTTPVDFSVAQATTELGGEMVVYASNPIIQKDLTSSRVIFTEERLRNLPNVSTVQAILTHYPGVVEDRNQAMHVRGGRSGQVSYYYDGFSVQDPFTASAGIRIMPSSLEELSLTSGGFTSEYGEALSGVVSAVTREGSSEYHGKARIFQGGTHPYDVNTGSWGDLEKSNNRTASFDLSGPIPGMTERHFSFFTAGEYLRDDGYLPHNWSTSYTGSGKVTGQPIANLKLKTNVTYHESDGAIYDHRDVNGVSYDFNLDGLPLWKRKAYLAGLSGNYTIGQSAILSLSASQFFTRTNAAPPHLMDVHWSQWPGYSEDENGIYNGTIDDDNYATDYDPSNVLHVTGFTTDDDYDPSYSFRQTKYNSFIAALVNQVSKTNQIKSGFEFRKYDIEWDFKQFYNSQPYGERYNNRPIYASFFLEDKLEYDAFVLNLGLRYDYRNADVSYNYIPDGDTVGYYKNSESMKRLSPRLGVSVPISTKSVMHFNYGVYYQVPRYSYMYTNLQGDKSTGWPVFGNPDLEPEETVSYEIGLNNLVGDNLRFDVVAYYKDIDNLVATRKNSALYKEITTMTMYTNDDYGTVTGVDLSVELLPRSNFFSGSISYGYMIAKGIGSYADEAYYTYITSATDTLSPIVEYPLDYDQRHTLTAVLDYRVPGDWSGNLFGAPIPGGWGLSMVGYYGSGLPYTKTDANGNRLGKRNEGRLPSAHTVDMRFNKDFPFNAGRMFTFFVEVDNLFNKRNVIDVYTRTGLPDDDANDAQSGLALSAEDIDKYDELYDHDPQHYSVPRPLRTGIKFSF